MPYLKQGPLEAGGYWREYGDGQGGHVREEYRVDLQTPALEVWAGRPDDTATQNEQHGTLMQLAVLTP